MYRAGGGVIKAYNRNGRRITYGHSLALVVLTDLLVFLNRDLYGKTNILPHDLTPRGKGKFGKTGCTCQMAGRGRLFGAGRFTLVKLQKPVSCKIFRAPHSPS